MQHGEEPSEPFVDVQRWFLRAFQNLAVGLALGLDLRRQAEKRCGLSSAQAKNRSLTARATQPLPAVERRQCDEPHVLVARRFPSRSHSTQQGLSGRTEPWRHRGWLSHQQSLRKADVGQRLSRSSQVTAPGWPVFELPDVGMIATFSCTNSAKHSVHWHAIHRKRSADRRRHSPHT
jgi:hypothetical protein